MLRLPWNLEADMSKRVTNACAAVLCAAGLAAAAERGTVEEAKALLARAVKMVETDGSAKAVAAFNDPQGGFRDRDLYVFCFGADGKVTAAANPTLIGNDISSVKDADGNSVGAKMLNMVAGGGGSIEYRFLNPLTKKVELKQSFLQKAGDQVCGVGAYK
jgi:signal transduction histidine kinase